MNIIVNGRQSTLPGPAGHDLLQNVLCKAVSGGYALQQCGPAHWVGVHPNGAELEITARRIGH